MRDKSFEKRPISTGIGAILRPVVNIPIQVQIVALEADRILADEAADPRVVVAGAVEHQARLGVALPRRESERVAHRLEARRLEVAEGVVVVAVGDSARRVRQQAHGAEVVGVVEELLRRAEPAVGVDVPGQCQRLVDLFPVAVACLQHVGSVIFQEYRIPVIHVTG